MKTYRKGQKVRYRLPGHTPIMEGLYMCWDGLSHRVTEGYEGGGYWNLRDEDLVAVKSRRKFKQPPVWAR